MNPLSPSSNPGRFRVWRSTPLNEEEAFRLLVKLSGVPRTEPVPACAAPALLPLGLKLEAARPVVLDIPRVERGRSRVLSLGTLVPVVLTCQLTLSSVWAPVTALADGALPATTPDPARHLAAAADKPMLPPCKPGWRLLRGHKTCTLIPAVPAPPKPAAKPKPAPKRPAAKKPAGAATTGATTTGTGAILGAPAGTTTPVPALTSAASTPTAIAAPGSAASPNPAAAGTTPAAIGTTPPANGTTTAASGTAPAAPGTVLAANGTTPAATGTTPAAAGTTPAAIGTTPADAVTTITVTATGHPKAPAPPKATPKAKKPAGAKPKKSRKPATARKRPAPARRSPAVAKPPAAPRAVVEPSTASPTPPSAFSVGGISSGPDAALLSSITGLLASSTHQGPPAYLVPIYKQAGAKYHIPWQILAAINSIETDYGRDLSVSSAGAIGWMQFMPETWLSYGVDATHSGIADPYDPRDAVFSAANYLAANGGGQDIAKAVFAYNHATWYVDAVLWRARQIGDPHFRALRAPGGYALPLDLSFMKPFGRTDDGVDLEKAPDGAAVYSMTPGIVTAVASDPNGFGPNYPVVQVTAGPLKGRYVYYGHVAASLVKVGQTVVAGQPIAVMGHTGDAADLGHGHIEIGFSDAGGDPLSHHGTEAWTPAGEAMRVLLVTLTEAYKAHAKKPAHTSATAGHAVTVGMRRLPDAPPSGPRPIAIRRMFDRVLKITSS